MGADASRPEITAALTAAALSRLRRECSLVASEVWVNGDRRVDLMGMRLPSPMAAPPAALERAEFVYVEVKSCMDDFRSGHGLCLEGDESWLVCPRDLAERVRYGPEVAPAHILSPGAAGRLCNVQLPTLCRLRPASALELLWRMTARSSRVWRTSVQVLGEAGV